MYQVPPLPQLSQAVIDGDDQSTPALVEQSLAEGTPAAEILQQGLLAGMTEVGRRFREGEYYIPDVLVAAEAMKAGVAVLRPHLLQAGVRPEFTAVVGTVQGDLHDIGKNLVATMLEGAGFDVVDLGVDVPAEQFVASCQAQRVHVVGLSALLTTTMAAMTETVAAIQRDIDPPPVILVGGAPVSDQFAAQIGADGYGRDAATGAELARQLCAARSA